jgi:aspartate aminotransferase
MKLADRLRPIHPSATMALNAKAKALAATGVDVASLVAGEPDFDTPDFVKEAGIAAIKSGFTKYTASAGTPELRAAICDKLKNDNHLSFRPEQILVSCGAKHSFFNFCQAAINPGDEVIIFSPYWVSYPDMVKLAGGVPVIVETGEEDQYVPDPEALRRALSPRTRALVINSPSNPTGAVLSSATLELIAAAVRRHECLIVSDDIYEKLLFQPEPFVNIANAAPDLFERTVVINGMSKAFAMTGWRVGYTAGPQPLIDAMSLVQDQSTSNPSSISQKAAAAALRGPTQALREMVAEFRARRELCVSGLNAIDGVRCRSPEGAFYAFPSIRGLLGRTYKGQRLTDSMQVSGILLEDFQVAVVPGLPFGAEGYLRVSFATSRATIEKGLARIGQFVSALK